MLQWVWFSLFVCLTILFVQFLQELSKILVEDTSEVLRVSAVMDSALDNAGLFVDSATKAKFLRSLLRGVMKEDAVRQLRWFGMLLHPA